MVTGEKNNGYQVYLMRLLENEGTIFSRVQRSIFHVHEKEAGESAENTGSSRDTFSKESGCHEQETRRIGTGGKSVCWQF